MTECQNEFCGQTSAYVLCLSQLSPGDIVLSRETDSIRRLFSSPERCREVGVSFCVWLGSLGSYSHAMLYLDGSIIHAVEPGVFSYNPQRLVFMSSEDCCVLRYAGLSAKQLSTIAEFARNQVGRLYSVSEACRVSPVMKAIVPSKSGVEFCSRLVAQSFAAAGISLVENPDYCSPSDFLHSQSLKKIPNVVREAQPADVEVASSYDYVAENMRSMFQWMESARRIAQACGCECNTFEECVSFVLAHQESDGKVADSIIASGYLDNWKHEKSAHMWRYSPGMMLLMCRSGREKSYLLACSYFELADRYVSLCLNMRSLLAAKQSKTIGYI